MDLNNIVIRPSSSHGGPRIQFTGSAGSVLSEINNISDKLTISSSANMMITSPVISSSGDFYTYSLGKTIYSHKINDTHEVFHVDITKGSMLLGLIGPSYTYANLGSNNLMIGSHYTGYANTVHGYGGSILIGRLAGQYGCTNTVAIGNTTLNMSSQTGFSVVIGSEATAYAGVGYMTGSVIIGAQTCFGNSGDTPTVDGENTIIGSYAAIRGGGTRNVFIGHYVASSSRNYNESYNNVFIGNMAGYNNNSRNSIFIGYNAGYYETRSSKLIIENGTTVSPLIYGDLTSGQLCINFLSGSTIPIVGQGLVVVGDISGSGTLDIRGVSTFRNNITGSGTLDIQGVSTFRNNIVITGSTISWAGFNTLDGAGQERILSLGDYTLTRTGSKYSGIQGTDWNTCAIITKYGDPITYQGYHGHVFENWDTVGSSGQIICRLGLASGNKVSQFYGDITGSGTLDIRGVSTLRGDITGSGTLDIRGVSTLRGDITGSGTLDIRGVSTLRTDIFGGRDLWIARHISGSDALDIRGVSTLRGDITGSGTLDIRGVSSFRSSINVYTTSSLGVGINIYASSSLGIGANTQTWIVPDSAQSSYVHFGVNGDWYIRPYSSTSGKVIIADNGGDVFIGGSSTYGYGEKVAVTGDMYVSSNIWAGQDIIAFYTSDYRLKNNLEPIDNKIKELNVYKYVWNGQAGKDKVGKTDYGLIAQEVQKVYPELVQTRSDGYLGINYVKLVPILFSYIKDLNTKVNNLEERLNKLEGEK